MFRTTAAQSVFAFSHFTSHLDLPYLVRFSIHLHTNQAVKNRFPFGRAIGVVHYPAHLSPTRGRKP